MPVLRDVNAMNYAHIELGLAELGEKVCVCVIINQRIIALCMFTLPLVSNVYVSMQVYIHCSL